jgi:hypothetical protein
VKVTGVHHDFRQLAYDLVKVRSYGRYDINGFQFHSTGFETLRPLAATTNSEVVIRAIDAEGCETNYFRIINKILEFSFVRNNKLKVVFFDCDWFDNKNGTRQNQFDMVEVKHNERLRGYDTFVLAYQVEKVYYISYPCEKQRLYTLVDARYHDTLTLDYGVNEVYQEEELPASFVVEPGARFDNLVGDADGMKIIVK